MADAKPSKYAPVNRHTTPKETHGLAYFMAEQRKRVRNKLAGTERRIARRVTEAFSGPKNTLEAVSDAWEADKALSGYRGTPVADIEIRTGLTREVIDVSTRSRT